MSQQLSNERTVEYIQWLLGRYDTAWEKFEGHVPNNARGWFEDVKLAMYKIYSTGSIELDSFQKLYSLPLYGRDLARVFYFLKGRAEEITFWQGDGAGETPVVHPKTQLDRAPSALGGKLVRGSNDKRQRIFVVHGRDERLRSGIFTFLRSVGLQPLEFGEARQLTGKPMPYVGEILEAAFQHAQAVVVLLTPDDEARLRSDLVGKDDPIFEKELNGQPRPNVLFEAGMALVTHPDQTVLVQFGQVRPFSDVAGRHILHMNNSVAKRQEFAQRLEAAQCLVNLKGTDWHTSGDLNLHP